MPNIILEAVFRLHDKEESISISNIERHPKFDEVKDNLYCIYENCNARLKYVPKGKKRAYFSTWPKQDHSENCINHFEREKKARGERYSATATMLLSDQHIANILNDIRRKRKNKDSDVKNAAKISIRNG